MELIYTVIIFAFAIMFSNIVNRILPIIPLPVIQIILGVAIGMTELGKTIIFEPEIFLVMIIVPLLFREGVKADIASIVKNFDIILFLSFGVVLLTLLGVGLSVHSIMPTIPLAACFALGAALGPTDVVAVSSLSDRISLPKKVVHILEGEGMLNDASGVTAFQFAVGMLLTNLFSFGHAARSLLFASIAGVLLGWAIVWCKNQLLLLIERASARDVSGYLLIELLLPFLAYILAELVGASGIIAAVVTGILQANGLKKMSVFDAELANVSEAIWSTITFILNALVFLFLGLELVQVLPEIWNDANYSNYFLLFVVLFVTFAIFLIRLVSIISFYLIKGKIAGVKQKFNEILIMTFGGVKGTVSLATILVLPFTINGQDFVARPLLLFITASVILLSLLIGILVLPLLTDEEPETKDNSLEITLLNQVILTLQNSDNETQKVKINVVIETYRDRIRELYIDQLTTDGKKDVQELQTLIYSIDRDGLDDSFKKDEVSSQSYRIYKRFVNQMRDSISRQLRSFFVFWLMIVRHLFVMITHPKLFVERMKSTDNQGFSKDNMEQIKNVFFRNTEIILKSLDNLRTAYDEDLVQFFIDERLDIAQKMEEGTMIESLVIKTKATYNSELLSGFHEERRKIDEYEIAETIDSEKANELRRKVNLLESYSIQNTGNTLVSRFSRILKKKIT